jgi:hypothetical protein
MESANESTGLPISRLDFQEAQITNVTLGGADKEQLEFSFERWSINQNPVADDAAMVMLSLMARQLSQFIK